MNHSWALSLYVGGFFFFSCRWSTQTEHCQGQSWWPINFPSGMCGQFWVSYRGFSFHTAEASSWFEVWRKEITMCVLSRWGFQVYQGHFSLQTECPGMCPWMGVAVVATTFWSWEECHSFQCLQEIIWRWSRGCEEQEAKDFLKCYSGAYWTWTHVNFNFIQVLKDLNCVCFRIIIN